MTDRLDARGRWAARHAPALLLFCALTAVLMLPLLAAFGSAVPGWEGDNLYYVRSLWWMKHALFNLHISPFFDPTAYYPIGQHIARSEMTAANTIPALPITLLFGPVVAYNVVIVFSFVATGFFTYLWVERLTGRRAAGLLAGTIVAFLPFRFAHFIGHVPQATTQWVPATLYAFELFVARRTIGRAALVGAGAALVVLGCWYYGYALAIMLPIYAVCRTWRMREVWRDRAAWLGIAVAVAVAAVLTAPFLYQMLALREAGALQRSLAEMDSWSLNYYDFFIPNLLHPLWGDLASASFSRQRALWVEMGVALGYVAIAVALAGAFWRRQRAATTALVIVWVISYAIALGPTLHAHNRQVRITVPRVVSAAVFKGLLLAGDRTKPMRDQIGRRLPVPLPSLFMYMFVPFTSSMRVMARFGLWTALMTAALAGWGLIRLMDASDRRWGPAARGAIAAALIGAVVIESENSFKVVKLTPRPVDRWLAAQPASTVIVELPVEQGTRPFQNYWATINEKPNLFAWNGDSFPPPALLRYQSALSAFPSPNTIDFLRERGVTYVLVSPAEVPNWPVMSAQLEQSTGLGFEQAVGGVRLYRVLR